jgi:hypothetical protein
MGDTPSNGGNRPIARSPGATQAQPRSAARRTRQRQGVLVISCAMLLAAALTVVVVVAAEFPIWVQASKSPQTAAAIPDSDVRTAKITKSLDGTECWQTIFDNQTGRMTRTRQPCEATAYDGNGAPISAGASHRLDAISKSFWNH